MTTVGRYIRRTRERRFLTMDELAREAGLCASNMGFIESGVRGVGAEEAARIADALGVTIVDLFGASREPGEAVAGGLPV